MNHTLCIAPMMAYTDRHCRYLFRLFSKQIVLYTEMVTDNAILYGKHADMLSFSEVEHPVAVQLGGSNPKQLAAATKIASGYGYNEINLNVGCPSERVQNGCFGAALMKTPVLVAECVSAMREATETPVTVKTRFGVDEYDSDYFLADFIGKITETGCQTFILHARKAWLSGLSPKENRSIPPLQYERVYRMKKQFPSCEIIVNGGITTEGEIQTHLQHVDGVMLGRVVCNSPYCLTTFSAAKSDICTREAVLRDYLVYIEKQYAKGAPLRQMTRHLIGLYQGEPGARTWRRTLSETTITDANLISYLHRVSGGSN